VSLLGLEKESSLLEFGIKSVTLSGFVDFLIFTDIRCCPCCACLPHMGHR
jgi:hypothetical protein